MQRVASTMAKLVRALAAMWLYWLLLLLVAHSSHVLKGGSAVELVHCLALAALSARPETKRRRSCQVRHNEHASTGSAWAAELGGQNGHH